MEEVTTAQKKILVVEDDPEIRAATVRLLTRTGYQVFEAENGVRGLEAALGHEVERASRWPRCER